MPLFTCTIIYSITFYGLHYKKNRNIRAWNTIITTGATAVCGISSTAPPLKIGFSEFMEEKALLAPLVAIFIPFLNRQNPNERLSNE